MKVSEVMTSPAEVVCSDTTLAEAARKMRDLNIGALPVCDGEKLVGILTDRDVTVRAVAEGRDPNQAKTGEIVSTDLVVCRDDEEVAEAERRMQEHHVRRLAVLNQEDHLVGILTLGDLATRHNERCGIARTLEVLSEADQAQ